MPNLTIGTTNRLRLLLALLCVLLWTGTAAGAPVPPAPTAPPGGPDVTVPFTTIPGGLMLLRAHLTGPQGQQADATLLFDTGTDSCQLTERLASKLGLARTPATGPDGKPIISLGKPAQQVVVPLIMLGILRVPNAALLVAGNDTLTNILGDQGTGLDGIIGGNFLTNASAVIDPQYKVVGFFAHPLTPADITIVGMDKAVEVPLQATPGGTTYTCRARMASGDKGDEADLLVDTGSDLTLVPAAAEHLGLTDQAKRDSVGLVTGNRGVYQTTLPSLTLPAAGKHGVIVLGLRVIYSQDKLPEDVPPVVGMNVLSQFRVLLDFPDKKMYLLPVKRPASTPVAVPPPAK